MDKSRLVVNIGPAKFPGLFPTKTRILAIQAVCTVVEIFFNSTREKLLNAHLDRLAPALQQHYSALDNQILTAMEIIGMGVGFVLIAGVNYRIAFGVDALTFLSSALILTMVQDLTEKSLGSKLVSIAEVRRGVDAVLRDAVLRRSTGVRALFWVAAGIFNMLELKLVSEYFAQWNAASTVAVSKAMYSLGFVIGLYMVKRHAAKVLATARNEVPGLFGYCGMGNFAATVCTAAIVAFRNPMVLGSVIFVYGAGTGFNSFGMRRIRQLATAADQSSRGRVIAFTNMVASVCGVVGMVVVVVLGGYGIASSKSLLLISGMFMGLSAWLSFTKESEFQRGKRGSAIAVEA